MIKKQSRSLGICVLGWTVISANVLLYLVYYFDIFSMPSALIQRTISFIAMLAVFPYDLFSNYFSTQWQPQMVWVMMVVVCAFGILLLNKFARAFFMLLNVFQIVVLTYLVLLEVGHIEFLSYAFTLYFTLVASGSYIIYLTLPEVREQFHLELEGLKLQIFLQKPLGKKVRPSDAKKHAGLSKAYLRLERYDAALEAINKAIQGQPEQAEYYFQLGMIQIKQCLFSQAISALKRAIELDPVYYEAYYNLGILYVQQGCSHEAAQMFQHAIHVHPQESQAYRDLGDAYFSLGKYEKALQQFQKAISLSQKDAYAYYRMGCIQTEYLDQHQEALEALRAAVRIEKNFCDAHFQLGKICIKLKRYKEAVRAFKDVIAIEDDHVQAHYHLGFVYALLKDLKSAQKQCLFLKKYDEDLAENLSLLLNG